MAIYKAKVPSHFAIIPNETAQDLQLSFEARGLLTLMLSMPEDWAIHKEWLIKQSPKCGRDKMTRILRELIDCGYVVKKAAHVDGQFAGVDWIVYAEPHSVELKTRRTEKQSDCKSNTIKETSLQRNNSTKKDITDTLSGELKDMVNFRDLNREDYPLCAEAMSRLNWLHVNGHRVHNGKLSVGEWDRCELEMASVDSFDCDYFDWWLSTRSKSMRKTPSLPNMLCEVNGIPFDQFYDSTFMQEWE